MKLAKKLTSVPLEYQASVYAKETKLRREKEQEKKQKKLLEFRARLKILNEKLRATNSEELRIKLKKEIAAQEKAIKKLPRQKRKWSPILPGSFESSAK